jgi:hypothetical protein
MTVKTEPTLAFSGLRACRWCGGTKFLIDPHTAYGVAITCKRCGKGGFYSVPPGNASERIEMAKEEWNKPGTDPSFFGEY